MKLSTLEKNYKNKKIFVTGSTGFKGSWLCFWLHKMGAKVTGIGLKPEKGSIIFKTLKIDQIIKQYYFDITDYNKTNNLIIKFKPDLILHLAAQSVVSESYSSPLDTINTNIIGTANILESTRVNKIKNLIIITSDKCYLNKEKNVGYRETDELGGYDNYSSSKAAAENIFNSYYSSFFFGKNVKHATVRAGNVIGGGDFKKDRIIPDIIKAIIAKKSIEIRNPQSTRPWQHVLEPISGYLRLGELLMKNKIKKNTLPSWNFGPNKYNKATVLKVTQNILKIWKKSKIKIKIKKNKTFKETYLLSLNIEKSKKELGWTPKLNFAEIIKYTVDWYEAYLKKEDMISFTNSQIEKYVNKNEKFKH